MMKLHPEKAPPFSVEAEIDAAFSYAAAAEAKVQEREEILWLEAKKRAMTGEP